MMTLADHCEIILRELVDAGPLSMDDLHRRTELALHPINVALTNLLLGGRVAPRVVRARGRKVTVYDLKRRHP